MGPKNLQNKMGNVKKGLENNKFPPTSRKVVKRLKPNNIGNSLMKKLEPTLPFAKRTAKFKSPYKSPKLPVKNVPISNGTEKQVKSTPISNQPIIQSLAIKPNQTGNKLGEVGSSKPSSISFPKMSPVKIQPIDPYQFCEPILKYCTKSNMVQKDQFFNRTEYDKRRVNKEVLTLIKRTAEAIKIIRSQHEEWKKNQQ